MAKPSLRPSAAVTIIPVKRYYTDETQKTVENLFVRGSSLYEIEEILNLKPAEAQKRYLQVLNYYTEAAQGMTDEWTRVRVLCLMKQSEDRCRVLQEQVDMLLGHKYLRKSKQYNPDTGEVEEIEEWESVFPAKEYKALQDEQKNLLKIHLEIAKLMQGKKQKLLEETQAGPPSQRRDSALHSRFREIKQASDQCPPESLLTDSQRADLDSAATTRTVFEGMGMADEDDD